MGRKIDVIGSFPTCGWEDIFSVVGGQAKDIWDNCSAGLPAIGVILIVCKAEKCPMNYNLQDSMCLRSITNVGFISEFSSHLLTIKTGFRTGAVLIDLDQLWGLIGFYCEARKSKHVCGIVQSPGFLSFVGSSSFISWTMLEMLLMIQFTLIVLF